MQAVDSNKGRDAKPWQPHSSSSSFHQPARSPAALKPTCSKWNCTLPLCCARHVRTSAPASTPRLAIFSRPGKPELRPSAGPPRSLCRVGWPAGVHQQTRAAWLTCIASVQSGTLDSINMASQQHRHIRHHAAAAPTETVCSDALALTCGASQLAGVGRRTPC